MGRGQTIRVDPELVRRAAKAFKEAGQSSSDEVQKVQREVAPLEQQWEGVTQARFWEQYQEWQGKMKSYVEVLNSIGDQLDSIADAFEQTDQDIAAQIARQ